MFQFVALMLLSQQALQPVSEGWASYYNVRSCGPVTASGDRLNDKEFSCAMKDGTFGDYFLVVAENGNTVVCRLNDRGPWIKGRVIDLSEAAMRKLHKSDGLLRVKVYKICSEKVKDLFERG
jgi:rare lipoprotein A